MEFQSGILFKLFALCMLKEAILMRTDCPYKSLISPCICTKELAPDNKNATWINCENISSLPNLTKAVEKMKGYHLELFELVRSEIKYLPANLFFQISIESIKIRDTSISRFTEAEFSAFYGLEEELKSLSMRRCSLVNNLQWQKISELKKLTTLDLSYNKLTEIPTQWFHHPPQQLKILYLKGNNISTIHEEALSKIFGLTFLDLSENNIVHLKRSMLPLPSDQLIYLHLSYNRISTLPADFFHNMFALKRVYLDHNKITVLNETVWNPIWSALTHLDLLGNEIVCDCSVKWITKLKNPWFFYGTCKSPQNLQMKKLSMLQPWYIEDCKASLNEISKKGT